MPTPTADSLGGLPLSAAVHTKESALHKVLEQQATHFVRLAMKIWITLESADAVNPGINDLVTELATLKRGR